jgi:hypothetical protein
MTRADDVQRALSPAAYGERMTLHALKGDCVLEIEEEEVRR